MIRTLPARMVAVAVLAPAWAVGLALLVKGHAGTGDGFSGGLTAGVGVLVHALVLGAERTAALAVVRRAALLVGAGLLLVLAPVTVPLVLGDPPMTHYPAPGSHAPALGTFSLHSGFVLDCGVFLVVVGMVALSIDRFAAAAAAVRRADG